MPLMHFTLIVSGATVALVVGMLVLVYVGRRIGAKQLAKDPVSADVGTTTVDAALLGLLGLLIAFTLSGAGTRFDTRRNLIVEETNAIGTAYLRLDLVPTTPRLALQDLFRRYLESRLEIYRQLPDLDAARTALAQSATIQREIWSQAVAAVRMDDVSPTAALLLLPALNQMIDLTTTRTMATQMHPPASIFVLMFALALVAALLVGYDMARRRAPSWIHVLGFATIMATALFVILDLEYPRLGFMRVDRFDRALVELRSSMR
jgi:uncharacterized protein YneF (UPF0154 family)